MDSYEKYLVDDSFYGPQSHSPVRHHPFPEDDEDLDHNDRWRGEDEELIEDMEEVNYEELGEDDEDYKWWPDNY